MHTYAYLELFNSVFSLTKQIFQLFQFIRAILRLLKHAKRLKFENSKILLKFSNPLKFNIQGPYSLLHKLCEFYENWISSFWESDWYRIHMEEIVILKVKNAYLHSKLPKFDIYVDTLLPYTSVFSHGSRYKNEMCFIFIYWYNK